MLKQLVGRTAENGNYVKIWKPLLDDGPPEIKFKYPNNIFLVCSIDGDFPVELLYQTNETYQVISYRYKTAPFFEEPGSSEIFDCFLLTEEGREILFINIFNNL